MLRRHAVRYSAISFKDLSQCYHPHKRWFRSLHSTLHLPVHLFPLKANNVCDSSLQPLQISNSCGSDTVDLVKSLKDTGYLAKNRKFKESDEEDNLLIDSNNITKELLQNYAELTFDDIASCLWAFAQFSSLTDNAKAFISRLPEHQCFQLREVQLSDGHICQHVLHPDCALLSIKHLAQVMWALAKLRYHNNLVWSVLSSCVYLHFLQRSHFSGQSLSLILWALAEIEFKHSAAMFGLTKLLLAIKPYPLYLATQGIANICWAYARLKIHTFIDGAKSEYSLEESADLEYSFTSASSANSHIESLGSTPPDGHLSLHSTLPEIFDAKSGTNLTVATLNKGALEALYKCLSKSACHKMSEMSEEQLTKIAWAFVLMDYTPEKLFSNIYSTLLPRLHDFHLSFTCVIVWCLYKAKHVSTEMLEIACKKAATKIDLLSCQDLATLLLVCAKTGYYHHDFIQSAKNKIIRRPSDLDPKSLAICGMSFASFAYYNKFMFVSICALASGMSDRFRPQGISMLLWSLAKVRHYDPSLMDIAAVKLVPAFVAGTCVPHDISMTALAFAQLRHYRAPLFRAVAEASSAALDAGTLTPRHLVNIVWAMAVVEHIDEVFFEKALAYLSQYSASQLGFTACRQLFQAHTLMQNLYGGIIPPPMVVSPSEEAEMRIRWQETALNVTESKFQQDVMRVLTQLGVKAKSETITKDGLFSIDISFRWRGRRVALEADGSYHFTVTTPHRPLGSMVAKSRCLEARGWVVLSVPQYKWVKLMDDRQKQHYLRQALDALA